MYVGVFSIGGKILQKHTSGHIYPSPQLKHLGCGSHLMHYQGLNFVPLFLFPYVVTLLSRFLQVFSKFGGKTKFQHTYLAVSTLPNNESAW